MGGHALTPGLTRRYKADEYHRLAPRVVRKLARALWPADPRIAVIPALRHKADFGDMDVLLADEGLSEDWVERVQREFDPAQLVRNGAVLSFDFDALQIDVILASPEEYDWSLAYFSYGDTGNLIGRVAHRMGLKFGHDGLWLPYRDGDYLFRQILVTRHFPAALAFLGFNTARWQLGFDTQEDVFRFIAEGDYFDPEIYAPENRTARDRVRDRKRVMYGAFLAWCAEHAQRRFTEWPAEKREWLEAVFRDFPTARSAYARAEEDLARQKAVRAKFDGARIGQVTGLSGQSLGSLMRAMRAAFMDQEHFETYMLATPIEEIDNLARRMAEEKVHEQV